MELHYELYGPSLSAHPFFEVFLSQFPYVVKRFCHCAMSTMIVASGDIVFNTGEIPTTPRMYITSSGVLNYVMPSEDRKEIDLREGSWIAEAALWVAWTHRGTL